MTRKALLLAAALALVLTAPLAQADVIVNVGAPRLTTHLGDDDPITVGGFCVLSVACVETYCVETLRECCPRLPPAIDPGVYQCTRT